MLQFGVACSDLGNYQMDLVKVVENLNADRGFPEVYPGDYVRVHISVVEGNRSRIQVFHGTVIRNRGNGQNRTFTVRRIASHGIGVERTFLYKSPRVEKIEVVRHNKVRRAQLYYMRELRGKSARLKEIRVQNRNKPRSGVIHPDIVTPIADVALDMEPEVQE